MNVRYYDQRPDCVGGLKYPTRYCTDRQSNRERQLTNNTLRIMWH